MQFAIPPKKHFRAQKQTKKVRPFQHFHWWMRRGQRLYSRYNEKQSRALMYILDIRCKCIFWTFTASIYLHKNEVWIRTYIFCNITFVKWVNTEVLHVTKPNWLHWMQLYAWRENITEATGVKSHWKFRQARSCHNRNGLKQ